MRNVAAFVLLMVPFSTLAGIFVEGEAWVADSDRGLATIHVLNDHQCSFGARTKPSGPSLVMECTFAETPDRVVIAFPAKPGEKWPDEMKLKYSSTADTLSLVPSGRTFERTSKSEAQRRFAAQ